MELGFINIIFCFGIFIYFIIQRKNLKEMKSLNSEILKFSNILIAIKKEEQSEIKITEEESTNGVFFKFLDSVGDFDNCKLIKENIYDYTNALKTKGKNSVNPSLYFNEGNTLDRIFNIQSLNQVSPNLVGAGILGTFFGLFMGLQNLDLDNLDIMISSMSLAFTTSLFGMGFSLVFSYCYRHWMGEVLKNINQVEHNLSLLFPIETDINSILIKMDLRLQELNSGLTKSLITGVSSAVSKSSEIAGLGLKKSVDNLSKGIGDQLNMIFNDSFLSSFKDLQKLISESVTSLEVSNGSFKTLSTRLPKITTELEKMSVLGSDIFDRSQKSMENYDKYMKGTENFLQSTSNLKELQANLNNTFVLLDGVIQKNNSSMKESAGEISNSIKSLTLSTNNTLEKYSEILHNNNKSIEESISKTNNSMVQSAVQIDSSMKQATVKIDGSLNLLSGEINNILEQFRTRLIEYSNHIAQVEDKTEKIITDFENEYSSKNEYFNNQYSSIANSQKQLLEVINGSLNQYDMEISKILKEILTITNNLKDMKQ